MPPLEPVTPDAVIPPPADQLGVEQIGPRLTLTFPTLELASAMRQQMSQMATVLGMRVVDTSP